MTFVLEGAKEVPAHKIMLTRCPYFAVMFSTDMREKTAEKIKIENTSHNVFLLVLRYLYTDECEITLEVITFGANLL